MTSLRKVIQIIDGVCDCLPVISTLTNGAQMLYKLAHKVDAAANPVATGFKAELKIHVLNKPHSWICLVPVFGNLMNLINLCFKGFFKERLPAETNDPNLEKDETRSRTYSRLLEVVIDFQKKQPSEIARVADPLKDQSNGIEPQEQLLTELKESLESEALCKLLNASFLSDLKHSSFANTSELVFTSMLASFKSKLSLNQLTYLQHSINALEATAFQKKFFRKAYFETCPEFKVDLGKGREA